MDGVNLPLHAIPVLHQTLHGALTAAANIFHTPLVTCALHGRRSHAMQPCNAIIQKSRRLYRRETKRITPPLPSCGTHIDLTSLGLPADIGLGIPMILMDIVAA